MSEGAVGIGTGGHGAGEGGGPSTIDWPAIYRLSRQMGLLPYRHHRLRYRLHQKDLFPRYTIALAQMERKKLLRAKRARAKRFTRWNEIERLIHNLTLYGMEAKWSTTANTRVQLPRGT